MATALVVDDAKVDQRLVGRLLENGLSLAVVYAGNGHEALTSIERQAPDVVITDMRMPEMDGLELVEAIRREHPAIPVILMTAIGSEELAAEALRKGAASYVPKRYLSKDLTRVVERLLAVAGVERRQQSVLECLQQVTTSLVLDNDFARILPLVSYLQHDLARMNLCDDTAMMRVGVSLEEALTNAIYHGNLGLGSKAGEADAAHAELVEERSRTPPYCHRHVYITAEVSRSRAVYVVRDDGEGFDPSSVPNPTDPINLEKAPGRGLCLIHAFMDDVYHNDIGNEITMIKRSEADLP